MGGLYRREMKGGSEGTGVWERGRGEPWDGFGGMGTPAAGYGGTALGRDYGGTLGCSLRLAWGV